MERAALELLCSAERCLGIRLCYHDYLRKFNLPYSYCVHESATCMQLKKKHNNVCQAFCGADGEIDRTIRAHSSGWLHFCPLGIRKIALAVTYEGCLAGVLFAECSPRQDGLAKKGNAGYGDQESKQSLLDRQHLLLGVARQLEFLLRGTGEDQSDGRRGKILHYIEEQIGAPADLAGLGRVLNLSASRAGHLVQEIFGRSYRELALEARANRAALLLAGTENDLSSIALRLGFNDQSHFTRVFRQHFQLTPAVYRRKFMHHQ